MCWLQEEEVCAQELFDLGAPEACLKLMGQVGYPQVRIASLEFLSDLIKGNPGHALRLVRSGLIPLLLPLLQTDCLAMRHAAKHLLYVMSPSVLSGCTALHALFNAPARTTQHKPPADRVDIDPEIRQIMHAYGDCPHPSQHAVDALSSLARRFVAGLLESANQQHGRGDNTPCSAADIARMVPEYAMRFKHTKDSGLNQWSAWVQLTSNGPLQHDRKLVERVQFAKGRLESLEEESSDQHCALLTCLNTSLVHNKKDRFRRFVGITPSTGKILHIHTTQCHLYALYPFVPLFVWLTHESVCILIGGPSVWSLPGVARVHD